MGDSTREPLPKRERDPIPVRSRTHTYGPWLVIGTYTYAEGAEHDMQVTSGQLPTVVFPSWLGLTRARAEEQFRAMCNPINDPNLTIHVVTSGEVDYI